MDKQIGLKKCKHIVWKPKHSVWFKHNDDSKNPVVEAMDESSQRNFGKPFSKLSNKQSHKVTEEILSYQDED